MRLPRSLEESFNLAVVAHVLHYLSHMADGRKATQRLHRRDHLEGLDSLQPQMTAAARAMAPMQHSILHVLLLAMSDNAFGCADGLFQVAPQRRFDCCCAAGGGTAAASTAWLSRLLRHYRP